VPLLSPNLAAFPSYNPVASESRTWQDQELSEPVCSSELVHCDGSVLTSLDTLDLQDQRAPSAKDHSKQPSNPPPEGIAPHQELTIRHADQDLKSELMHGPDGQADDYDEQEDMNGEEDNEHRDGSDDGDFDGEDDDLLDDDLMDKISSSPSIDDGA
jgi:hypothetical protein